MKGGASRSLDQQRARHAWNAVNGAKTGLSGGEAEEFAAEAKRMPVRIMTSGLGQSIAFLRAKGGKARNRLVDELSGWIFSRDPGNRNRETGGRALTLAIMNGDSDFLRHATEEALMWLQWLTRFAEAEIGTNQDPGTDG